MKIRHFMSTVCLLCGAASLFAMGNQAKPAPAGSASGGTAGGGLKIAIVTAFAGVDDGSFNQDCYGGIRAFITNNPTATVNVVMQDDPAKAIQSVADSVADYDVFVLPGFNFAPVGDIFKAHPDRKAILVDTAPLDSAGKTLELPNVYSMQFHEEQPGFFAGVAAALETKSGKVAVVNGIAFPSNVNYEFGFYSGVNYANKYYGSSARYIELPDYAGTDVTGKNVGGNYIGDFGDAAVGKKIGEALMRQGADVIYVADGAAGLGVFAAAKERDGVFIIGVDVDQYDEGAAGARNVVLTSTLKKMGVNVTRQLDAVKNGTFKGQNATLGADTDSVGFVSAPARQQLSQNTLDKLADAYVKVKSGEIVPAANFNGSTPDKFKGL